MNYKKTPTRKNMKWYIHEQASKGVTFTKRQMQSDKEGKEKKREEERKKKRETRRERHKEKNKKEKKYKE